MTDSWRVSRAVGRDASVDVARGVAIVAIVLGHVLLGLTSAGVLSREASAVPTRALYLFHLSTFAYLSGLFVARGVERAGGRGFVARRIALFTWLYVLWGLAQGSVRAIAGSSTNTPTGWTDVIMLWIPEGQLWFLPWLMCATVVAVVLGPWRSPLRAGLSLAAASVLAVVVWGLEPPWIFSRGWALLLPFLVGCRVSAAGHARLMGSGVVRTAMIVLGLATWAWAFSSPSVVLPTTHSDARTVAGIALGVLGCAGGTMACLAVSAVLARTPAVGPFAALGRRSLEIFLAHIIAASGARVFLTRLGVGEPLLHVVIGVVLGLAVPVALAVLCDRLGWTWVFGLPQARGTSKAPSARRSAKFR